MSSLRLLVIRVMKLPSVTPKDVEQTNATEPAISRFLMVNQPRGPVDW
jgi:hypothetical protein